MEKIGKAQVVHDDEQQEKKNKQHSKTRSSSGKAHWAKFSSSAGTLSNSYDRYAMATHRKLLTAMSLIAALKNSYKKEIEGIIKNFYLQSCTQC